MSNDGEYEFTKEHESDVFWRANHRGQIGEVKFSPDKVKIFNMFTDYPDKFTAEEKRIFDKEQPLWAKYFGGG